MKGEELISRATAIEALGKQIDLEHEIERRCDINCCDPQSDSAANHWGTENGLKSAIQILGALPVVPTDDGCYFCALWFLDVPKNKKSPLPMHDFILTPVPLVPQSDETLKSRARAVLQALEPRGYASFSQLDLLTQSRLLAEEVLAAPVPLDRLNEEGK